MSSKNRKKLWIGWLPLVALFVLLVSVLGVWYWKQVRPYERTEYADVSWSVSGEPAVFSCSVVDKSGRPVPNVIVSFDSNSGWTPYQTTDKQGRVKIRSAEYDVQGIQVNGRIIMSRPYAYFFGGPSVKQGLKVEIVLKGSESLYQQSDH